MTQIPRHQLQSLLLNMLSTRSGVDFASVSALGPHDWEALLGMARQHRLLPLLHWRLTRERDHLPVPQSVRDELAAGFKRSAMRALRMQRELLLTHRILDDVDIPHLALKGAYLAFYAYPHAALRPMRDLDILVPKDRALKAYQALLEAGFTRSKRFRGDLEAILRSWNHLPPLISASGRICIELHTRISNPGEGRDVPDLVDDRSLWQRAIGRTVSDGRLSYLSPTDLLLHLIEHAVYRHRFDNGPLVLSDLAYLLENHEIDWTLFWQRTELYAQTRGTLLLLKMVERYFGKQSIEWPPRASVDSVSPDMVETAALLTLRDVASRTDANLASNVAGRTSRRGKLGILLKRAFPSRREMATFYPVSEHSPRIYLWYAVRWWYLSTVRLPEYLRSRARDRTAGEARDIFRLEQWLQEAAH